MKTEVLVIGGGPGGYVAAIRAAQNGKKVTLAEREWIGGTCLNIGCIPTKALLAAADTLRTVHHASDFGIQIDGAVSFDWNAMQIRKNETVAKLRQGISGLLKAYHIEVIEGTASFIAPHMVKVGETEIEADAVIIAAGSKAAMPGFLPKSPRIVTSTEILSLETLPKRLAILGGGVIGCEFASLMSALGVEVTIVEMLPGLLPLLDKEIGRTLTTQFKKSGIKVITGTPMCEITDTGMVITARAGTNDIEAELLLVAIGRTPDTAELNLSASGVITDPRGWIVTDTQCRTEIDGIYAIGDVTGKCQLAHAASAMGIVAAETISGKTNFFDPQNVPGCVFTHPEIGTVGLTSEQAAEKGIEVKSGKFPFAAIGKALAMGEPDGFCKIISDAQTDQILGVHIIGAHAADMISEAALAIQNGLTATALGDTIHPHPTLGEIMMETAHAVHGHCIHQAPPRKR